jgi:hypothetical protein
MSGSKMEHTISEHKRKKVTGAVNTSWKQINELLNTCKQVIVETKHIFADIDSKNGPNLERSITKAIEHLGKCSSCASHAAELVDQIPVTQNMYWR